MNVLVCTLQGFTSLWMVFQASLRPTLLSVLYRTSPSFRSRLAFSFTWSDGGRVCRHSDDTILTVTDSYLVCVDEEKDEEDEFSQKDDQQDDEELIQRKDLYWFDFLFIFY